MSIDDFMPDEWPATITTAMDNWRQGNLIQGKLGSWLAMGGRRDEVIGDDVPGEPGVLAARADTVTETGYLAVTSQTCDIAIGGPGRRHPFVQVSPVRDIGAAFAPDKVQQIREGQVVEYAYLTDPPVEGADWAVDLRMSIPVSKAVLADVTPIRGFLNEEDELAFSERVAAKIRRPALHDVISNEVTRSLSKLIDQHRNKSGWCAELEQLRLEISGGSRLRPKRVRLIAVTETKFDPDMCKPLRNEWKTHKKKLKAAGIEQAQMIFHTIDSMKVDLYRRSIPLNFPSLGRGNFM